MRDGRCSSPGFAGPACSSGVRSWCAAQRARTCSVRPLATPCPSVAACTRSARWCRTIRTGYSCAVPRRTSRSGRQPQLEARDGCRIARSGTLRARPSNWGFWDPTRSAVAVPAHEARLVSAQFFRETAHDLVDHPDSRAAGTSGRSCDAILSHRFISNSVSPCHQRAGPCLRCGRAVGTAAAGTAADHAGSACRAAAPHRPAIVPQRKIRGVHARHRRLGRRPASISPVAAECRGRRVKIQTRT